MSDRNRKVGQLVINQPKLIPGIHWLFKINDLCQSIKSLLVSRNILFRNMCQGKWQKKKEKVEAKPFLSEIGEDKMYLLSSY